MLQGCYVTRGGVRAMLRRKEVIKPALCIMVLVYERYCATLSTWIYRALPCFLMNINPSSLSPTCLSLRWLLSRTAGKGASADVLCPIFVKFIEIFDRSVFETRVPSLSKPSKPDVLPTKIAYAISKYEPGRPLVSWIRGRCSIDTIIHLRCHRFQNS